MSLSLIGIIFVQAYYINNTVKNKEDQFAFNVKNTLEFVAKAIEERESRQYYQRYQNLISNTDKADSIAIRELFIKQEDEGLNETLIYRNGILEENFKLSTSLFDIGLDTDSITLQRLTGRRETKIFSGSAVENDLALNPIKTLLNIGRISEVEKSQFEMAYRDLMKRKPIHKRVSEEEINRLFDLRLQQEQLDLNYEFAIYSKDLATKVQSDDFELKKGSTFGTPIFLDNENRTDFNLLINFPERQKFILSSILGMAVLSVLFTIIIFVAFTTAIYQLIKQRKISRIKTDFINNMTHEFKTPIATINLALDAIRNPQVIEDQDKVKRYLSMIKDENKRMHAQVENVLRISKLEKNELNISKDRVKLHDLIDDAIAHIDLIVKDRNGYVKTDLRAEHDSVLANETHFTSVIVNVLDNAVKYSPDNPKIKVYTENVGNSVLLKITDKGSGMSKAAQKKVFDKFYREQTGDIHNVKGHGLGLAYVKRIVEDH
ncbi:MAG: HAMP domain-containing histidine kinase, partial [Bacteroidia bacterium]|nr:HAMP domain-containing histidine kinase [Bacteroidia bacterium]